MRNAEIVVSTVQSLLTKNKYKRQFKPDDFQLIISDEAHRSIGGNSRAVFEYFIGYKLDREGGKLIEVDRFFPSSKLCSNCGVKNTSLTLSIRDWICSNPDCLTSHDRQSPTTSATSI